ncbi:uncharacterized protein LOC134233700 [Saccostrea cucullata]|uniref:uncharacterized protein LOC134233700 n=1 Tax=Saccostrea cuccullata TaxID=36930 RepID=UPI002ED0BD3C
MILLAISCVITLWAPVHCVGEDLPLPFHSQDNFLPPILKDVQLQELESMENVLKEVDETHRVQLDHQLQLLQQDEYLSQYGLYRTHIQGDGNCLFRSVSFGLYGTEDHHISLRELAVNHIQENLEDFRFYLYGNSELPMTDSEIVTFLNNLRQLGTFAGQESIVALSRVLGLNILVTIGGDSQSPEVRTLEHNCQNSDNIIHLVWTRAGGGHYETVVENPTLREQTLPTSSENTNRISNNNISNYNWRSDSKTCKQISLDLLEDIKSYKIKNQNMEHSYGRQNVDTRINSGSKTKCPICNLNFYNKVTLIRHQKLVHDLENKNKIPCSISSCSLKFHNVDVLVDHLKNSHEACIEVENLSFENIGLFDQFKEEESIKIHCRYVKQRKNKINKDGSQSFTLVCHRDGVKRVHLKKGKAYSGKRKENIKGSCKIQKLCPSRMSVKIKSDGSVSVKYIKSHTHSIAFEESKFLPLPDSIKSEILTMLALKIPMGDSSELRSPASR